MTTETLYTTAEAAQAATVQDRTEAFLTCLNTKEEDRRKEVNAAHVAKYGRLLYPEGGQYAYYTLDKPGRKFTRVIQDTEPGGQYGKSVHAFIDRAGKVFMPAGWKGPAKGWRFDLMDNTSFLDLLRRCEFAGGYLYVAGR